MYYKLTHHFETTLPVPALTSFHHGNEILTGSNDGTLTTFTHKKLTNITESSQHHLTNSSIFDIKTTHSSIIVATGEPRLFILDRERDSTSKIEGHTKSINGLYIKNDDIFYSYSNDGTINSWDLRTYSAINRFKVFCTKEPHRSVISLEANNFNDKILYSGATPGANFDVWDERYWVRGSVSLKSFYISNSGIIAIKSMDGYVIALLSSGSLVRLGEMGKIGNVLLKLSGFHGLRGQILYIENLNLLVISSSEGVYLVHMVDLSYKFYESRGLHGVNAIDEGLLLYKSNGTLEVLNINI